MLQKITGLNKEQLFLSKDIKLTRGQQKEYDSCIIRFETGEPLEYILEQAEFYGEQFFVDNRVLIPRNDTEIMVDRAILEQADVYIDVGTGSGCISISVIQNSKQNFKQVYALDISKKALEVAEINIKNNNLEGTIKLLESDLLEKVLEKNIQNKQILITANLPYIKQDDFANMDESVYLNEPNQALYGGQDTGFELYEKLIGQCQKVAELGNSIVLFIELGFDQKYICEDFLRTQGFRYKIFKDSGGVERCARIKI